MLWGKRQTKIEKTATQILGGKCKYIKSHFCWHTYTQHAHGILCKWCTETCININHWKFKKNALQMDLCASSFISTVICDYHVRGTYSEENIVHRFMLLSKCHTNGSVRKDHQ